MTWTYDDTDPGGSDKDQVRLMVGDTDSADEQLTDEEITYFLTTYTTVGSAAVYAARAILAEVSRQVTRAVGDLRISLSDRAKAYRELIKDLEEMADASDPWQVYMGNQSLADRDADRANTDLGQPPFEVGMHDYTAKQHQHQHREQDPFH